MLKNSNSETNMELLGVERGLFINFQQPGKKEDVTKLEVRDLKPQAVDAASGG